jgi:predicted XRE-type DNA-binding protein
MRVNIRNNEHPPPTRRNAIRNTPALYGNVSRMAKQTPCDVAAEVRAVSARQNISHSHLAELIGITRMSMSRRMNGSVQFKYDELLAVSRVLNTPVGVFFGERAA